MVKNESRHLIIKNNKNQAKEGKLNGMVGQIISSNYMLEFQAIQTNNYERDFYETHLLELIN